MKKIDLYEVWKSETPDGVKNYVMHKWDEVGESVIIIEVDTDGQHRLTEEIENVAMEFDKPSGSSWREIEMSEFLDMYQEAVIERIERLEQMSTDTEERKNAERRKIKIQTELAKVTR